ncbi:MAG: RNA polymerase sigma-70 factor [Flavobacterium sp.]|nr:RNA polymerase sigma-70 factor [Flavobacterium sp.]
MQIAENNISNKELHHLLQLMSSGNEMAFKKLYDKYYDKIFAVALNFTKSKVIAEEIVQDVFLKIWLKREALTGVDNFEAYLFIMARNHIYNCLRSKMKDIVYLDYLQNYFAVVEDATSSLYTKDIYKLISEAREKLPPQQRRVFELSRYEGLNHKAIAEKLSISTLTVKAHLTKALQFIRQKLESLDCFHLLLIQAWVLFL